MANIAQITSHIGIEALKAFSVRVLEIARLDKNNDGDISVQEWGGAIFALVPELINIKQLTAEVRDLDTDEIIELVMYASQHFPDYNALREEVEAVIRAALRFVAVTATEATALIAAIRNLNKKPVDEPVVASTPSQKAASAAEQKKRPGASKKELTNEDIVE